MNDILNLVSTEIRDMYLDHLREPQSPHGRSRARCPEQYANIEPCDSILHGEDFDWSKVWVWSDQHFWHKNIIGFCDRPYGSVEQMNHELLSNYKLCVGKDDICIWVGDIAFGKVAKANHFLSAFPGYKILVVGNHDMEKKKVRKLKVDEVHLTLTVNAGDDLYLAFTHYPLVKNKLPHEFFTNMGVDVFNIHGHIHDRKIDDPWLYNVSVENIMYIPDRLGEIVKKMKQAVSARGAKKVQ